jgi:hypothetical protein
VKVGRLDQVQQFANDVTPFEKRADDPIFSFVAAWDHRCVVD